MCRAPFFVQFLHVIIFLKHQKVKTIKQTILLAYGLILSTVIGIIAAAFLVLEGELSELVWMSDNHLVEIALVIIGSALLYFLLKRWPDLPKTTHDSVAELKATQTIDYQDVFKNLLVTLVILSFGAGVGPEAALLSAIISLSIWQADNLRYFYFQYDELKQLPLHETLQRLFNPFKYRQKYDEKKAIKTPAILRWKKLLYLVFIINGIFAFYFLVKQTDQPSFILKLGQTNWTWNQLWVLPILVIGGYVIGWIGNFIGKLFKQGLQNLNLSLLTKIILGAVGIILVSYLAPDLLFSGQHSLHLLIEDWSNKSAAYLALMAVLKLLFLMWCLNLNWRGGDIFPVTFAAMAAGFAAAMLLPSIDKLLVVSITATAIMSELASPIVAGIFVMLFFPIQLSPIIILVAAIFFLKNKYLPKLAR